MINFNATKDETEVMVKIARRAVAMAQNMGIQYDMITAHMDINAVHANGNPLRLDDLLNAGNFDFAHDVFGIRQHLNRETGQLEDCFSPRYSARS